MITCCLVGRRFDYLDGYRFVAAQSLDNVDDFFGPSALVDQPGDEDVELDMIKIRKPVSAMDGTTVTVDSLRATSGIGVPLVLQDLEQFPADLVCNELRRRFLESDGRFAVP